MVLPVKVFITGATGLIGRALVLRLRRDGHQVLAWARSMRRARTLLGQEAELVDASAGIGAMEAAMAGCDAVINLAGAPVAEGRWTRSRKQTIVESRVRTTRDLVTVLGRLSQRPQVLVSASAVGYYGCHLKQAVDEGAEVGNDFLAQTCAQWEAAAIAAEVLGVRVVRLRIGVVLGHEGGVLDKLLPLFDRGMGGQLGNGKQFMPWVHLHDVAEIFTRALTQNSMQGAYNVAAPTPADNATFTQTLAQWRGTKPFLPVPIAALRLALGEAASMVVANQQVIPQRLEQEGYRFQFPTLEAAMAQLFNPDTVQIGAKSSTTPAPLDIAGDDYVAKRRPNTLLRAHTVVPRPVDAVFSFFCRPENLGLLTPIDMALQMVGEVPAAVQVGTVFNYTLRVFGLPLRWRTRIAVWTVQQVFVDSQERGPYRAWWHEHHFHPHAVGTHMEDRVHYAVGKGPLGPLAQVLTVKRQLERVFRHRASAITLRFGTPPT